MGKASSAKKVARAARAGGRTKVRSSQGRVFPVSVALIVALGVALVAYGKLTLSNRAEASPPTRDDHWHVAYGVYVCDKFVPSFTNQNDTINNGVPWGIHTHGDGVIHVHPFTSAATGRNATLGAYFKAIGVSMSDTELKVPADGEPAAVAAMPGGNATLANGAKCGDKDGTWQAAYWANEADDKPAAVYRDNFTDIRLQNDRAALTLAYVPDGTEVPKPASLPALDALNDVDPTATTIPGFTANPDQAPGATTVPGATVPGGTTAPGETAPGTTAPGETAPGTTAVPGETAPGTTAPAGGTTTATTTTG